VAQRPSAEKVFPDDSIAAKTHYVVHHPMEVSSTEIRERVSKGKSISEFVPSAVEKLIKKYNLYR
jgi:nicotinic acid mononucleotide adenylyltransferase